MTDKKSRLDELAQKHLQEGLTEAKRTPIDRPRTLRIQLPHDGHLPESENWLARLYAGDRMPREKKPVVFDHMRAWGPWMVSVDATPMSVLDGMSQTATLNSGFASDGAVRAYFEGAFDGLLVRTPDSAVTEHPSAAAYRSHLAAETPTIGQISFTNSGAEANEKAFALCKLNAANPGADQVIAFEGSFHGRTLQALHATWNPVKRAPYELDGFRVIFVPFPGRGATPLASSVIEQLLSACGEGNVDALKALASQHPEASADVNSLLAVADALSTKRVYALIIEPMQSEGGDRYGLPHFYKALRLLTRHHKVSMILDEVQTGFGLGGPYSWGLGYGLVDREGKPDYPDAMTWAKRAQVGFVNSRFEDPEPTSAHVASMVRGLAHYKSIGDGGHAQWVEAYVKTRLEALPDRYPQLVQGTRQRGYAFAFDLPTPEIMGAYIKQRFWRGAVVFAAGTRTIRYRLSDTYGAREIDRLFETIHASLDWLVNNEPSDVPAWSNVNTLTAGRDEDSYRVRTVEKSEREDVLDRIMAIEAETYEPARCDSRVTLAAAFEPLDGVAVVAEIQEGEDWVIVGSALAAALESFEHIDGPKQDTHLGTSDTAYSIAVTVHPAHRGRGLGLRLKQAQLLCARELKNTSGAHRYRFMTGRNRVGLADPMTHLNRAFGAYEVETFSDQYGEADAQAIYYRIPLQQYAPPPSQYDVRRANEWNQSICQPLATPPESLLKLRDAGGLFGPAVTKITVCNYITPAIVRAVEWVAALNPNHPHLYLTSCRGELIDKTIRTLKHHRTEAVVAIGLHGGYLGHTTAGCRALSDPAVHAGGSAARTWPRVPHPETQGTAAMVAALKETVEKMGGPTKVLGLFVEPIQERTGHVLDDEAWLALDAFRKETGIPIISIETASAYYRGQASAFASDICDIEPDIRAWWPGGQTGFIHLQAKYFVPKPLTMVSHGMRRACMIERTTI